VSLPKSIARAKPYVDARVRSPFGIAPGMRLIIRSGTIVNSILVAIMTR